MFFKKVTVENWTIVKVVGIAVLVKVDTEVIVSVAETVSWTVVGVVRVFVLVVTWTGTKRVDLVIEVKVVDCETVVKSVTTVGTNKVGSCPLTFKALLADCKVMAPETPADEPLGADPPKRFIIAADMSLPVAELIKDDIKSNDVEEENTFIWVWGGGYKLLRVSFALLRRRKRRLRSLILHWTKSETR